MRRDALALGTLLILSGCGALASPGGASDPPPRYAGVELVLTEEAIGSSSAEPLAPFSPIRAMVVDGSRLIIARDQALVALGPLEPGRELSVADQTALYITDGYVTSFRAGGTCILTEGGFPALIFARRDTLMKPFNGTPLWFDDAGLVTSVSAGDRADSGFRIQRLDTRVGCDPSATVALGWLPSYPEWVEKDATNLYATLWENPARVTYRVPLSGGGPVEKLPEARPEPEGPASPDFGTLEVRYGRSRGGRWPERAQIERVTPSAREVLWTGDEETLIISVAVDADTLYFATFAETCMEWEECTGTSTPSKGPPPTRCCKINQLRRTSQLRRVAKN